MRSDHSNGWRVPAGDVEGLMLDRLRAFFASEQEIGDAIAALDLSAATQSLALAKARQLAEGWVTWPSIELRGLVRSVIEQVKLEDGQIVVRLKRRAVALALTPESSAGHVANNTGLEPIEMSIEAKLRRAGKGIRLVVGGGIAERPDGKMVTMLRDAHATRDALMSGRDETIDAMAQRLGVKRDYLSAHMRVTYLAPDIVRVLVSGQYPPDLTPARLVSLCKDLPHDWQVQRTALGFETR